MRHLIAVALTLGLAAPALQAADLTPGERTITVAADQAVGDCYRFWGVGNFVEPHSLLDPKKIKAAHDCGPLITEFNLVYLLGGRWKGENQWFLGLDAEGKVRTDFTGMIAQLKAARDAGYAVRIVLDNVPDSMSDPPQANAYGNTAPPKDERVWGQYVEAAVRAMVTAFGRETVAGWSFRAGTEPDLRPGHWAGTREQYFAHYDHTVEAVRRVLPEAIVGPGNILKPGRAPRPDRPARPGRGAGRWGLDIIDHAATGTNACTGKAGTPMDVFSCSWYSGVGGSASGLDRAVSVMRERLRKYPQFANVQIEIGEHAVLGDGKGHRLYAGETTEWSASFCAAMADHVYAQGVRQVFQWDHATYGVLHPRGRVLEMLERMVGGKRLAVTVEGKSSAECGALACRKGDDLWILVYNHRPEREPNINETVHLAVGDGRMKTGTAWSLSEWLVDHDRSVWAYEFEADCKAAGVKPLPKAGLYEGAVLRLYGKPGVEVWQKNAAKYAKMSEMGHPRDGEPLAVGEGQCRMDIEMAGHSVRLIRLSPP